MLTPGHIGVITGKAIGRSVIKDAAPYCFVFPWGVEPQSLEPESNILSIELWEHLP